MAIPNIWWRTIMTIIMTTHWLHHNCWLMVFWSNYENNKKYSVIGFYFWNPHYYWIRNNYYRWVSSSRHSICWRFVYFSLDKLPWCLIFISGDLFRQSWSRHQTDCRIVSCLRSVNTSVIIMSVRHLSMMNMSPLCKIFLENSYVTNYLSLSF